MGLANGADPDRMFEGQSPLSACINACANPVAFGWRLPRFTPDGPADIVRALLMAHATPSADDLRQACYIKNPTIGKLLLDFGCSLEKPGKAVPTGSPWRSLEKNYPLLSIAAEHSPDLVLPLFLRGANPLETGPDGMSPMAIRPQAF